MGYDAWLERPYQRAAAAAEAYEWAQERLLEEGAECGHVPFRHGKYECDTCYDEDGLACDVSYEHRYNEHGGCDECEERYVEDARQDAAEAYGERMREY